MRLAAEAISIYPDLGPKNLIKKNLLILYLQFKKKWFLCF